MFLGEVLSVFRLFWWPLASCIVLGYFVGLWPFGNKFLLIQKKRMRYFDFFFFSRFFLRFMKIGP